MYNMNFYLKFLILILSIIITIFTGNFIVLWLLLFILTFINLWSDHKKQLLFDFVLIVLLAVANRINELLFIYKILFIINIIITFVVSLTEDEKYFLKKIRESENKNLKNNFYKKYYEKINDENLKKNKNIYGDEIINEDVVNEDLERHYLQSKIRFYGYEKKDEKIIFKFEKIDFVLLFFVIFVFIILMIIGR